MLASRDLMGGYNWVKDNASDENLAKAVEKQKKQYAGNEIQGKKFFTFGGAKSHDIEDGILDPDDYDDPRKYAKGTMDENYYCEIWIPVKKK